MQPLLWSPDSERIAFVDCLFDWVEKGIGIDGATPIGDATNYRCFIAVVGLTGEYELFPTDNRADIKFSWNGPRRLSAQIGGTQKQFTVK